MYYWTCKDKDEEVLRRSFVIARFNANDVLIRHRQFEDESRYGGVKLPDDALTVATFFIKTESHTIYVGP